jgi:hypothetical protein
LSERKGERERGKATPGVQREGEREKKRNAKGKDEEEDWLNRCEWAKGKGREGQKLRKKEHEKGGRISEKVVAPEKRISSDIRSEEVGEV